MTPVSPVPVCGRTDTSRVPYRAGRLVKQTRMPYRAGCAVKQTRVPYRAGRLHPRLAIDLHREAFAGAHHHRGALRQPAAGGAQARLHLAHVQAVLQADHLDHLVADVCHRETRSGHGPPTEERAQTSDMRRHERQKPLHGTCRRGRPHWRHKKGST